MLKDLIRRWLRDKSKYITAALVAAFGAVMAFGGWLLGRGNKQGGQ